MNLYDLLRSLHIGIGVIALTSFWIVAVLRKGTTLHRRTGSVYLVAMLGIVLTATPMALYAFTHVNPVTGVFLLYLALITATPAWLALRASRRRDSFESYRALPYLPLAWLNVAAGAAVLLLGIVVQSLLLGGMSLVGLSLGLSMTRVARLRTVGRNWWLQRHYTGMIGSGAAAHIAFLNLGLRHLVPAGWSGVITGVAWFGPVVATTAVVTFLNRRSCLKRRGGSEQRADRADDAADQQEHDGSEAQQESGSALLRVGDVARGIQHATDEV